MSLVFISTERAVSGHAPGLSSPLLPPGEAFGSSVLENPERRPPSASPGIDPEGQSWMRFPIHGLRASICLMRDHVWDSDFHLHLLHLHSI